MAKEKTLDEKVAELSAIVANQSKQMTELSAILVDKVEQIKTLESTVKLQEKQLAELATKQQKTSESIAKPEAEKQKEKGKGQIEITWGGEKTKAEVIFKSATIILDKEVVDTTTLFEGEKQSKLVAIVESLLASGRTENSFLTVKI